MVVYFGDEMDKIDDWIKKIEEGNKVMLSFTVIYNKYKIELEIKF